MSEADFPEPHYGTATSKDPNWRESDVVESDDDDNVLDVTPDDITKLLGFDPKDV